MRKVRHPISATYTKLIESKLTTRNVSRLYGVPYKFADVADMFCYLLFIERTESIIYSFRDVSLSWNGPGRDEGLFPHSGIVPGNPNFLIDRVTTK